MSNEVQNTAGGSRVLWIIGAIAFAGIGSFMVYSFVKAKNINANKK